MNSFKFLFELNHRRIELCCVEHIYKRISKIEYFYSLRNLDEATRNIYKENVQLTESLKMNIEENENMKKLNKLLYEDNSTLKADLELNKLLVQEKVELSTKQAKQIKDV